MVDLDDLISEEPQYPDRIDYSDYDEKLADVIDERVVNNTWRTNRSQCYYVTNVVERTLDRLSNGERGVREIRSNVQREIADEKDIRKQSVQAHCHARLFEEDEQPPCSHGPKSEWFRLFDQLIRELERTWYRDKTT